MTERPGSLSETLRLHRLWLQGNPQGLRADLGGANLRGANLRDADLRGANLRDANLRDANLRDADLGGASLGGASLGGADLRGADLGGADLRRADLGGADLRGANLRGADLRGADLRGADPGDAKIPIVARPHVLMLERIEAGGSVPPLEMSAWHANNAECNTQHCRAGWMIHFAGEAGAALEHAIGPAAAGALITVASCPYLERVPDFYCSNEEALADIRRCAAIEAGEGAA